MNRCRETAGILFKKRCDLPATQNCTSCNKPICRVHVRILGPSDVCISCARSSIESDPGRGRSWGHLQDDPYFFWYYESDMDDPYTGADYALFDAGQEALGAAVEDQWEGT